MEQAGPSVPGPARSGTSQEYLNILPEATLLSAFSLPVVPSL